jgi:phospholysine phosphohistidine inorganic pyrophosphate phosphatase
VSGGLAGVRALLVDLEGTVYQDRRLIPGAAEALAAAEARGIPHRFVTNTTSRPRSVIARELGEMGLCASPDSLFTAPRAAHALLEARGISRIDLLAAPRLLEDLPGIAQDDDAPQAVVLGDLGGAFTYERLNRAFRHLLAGAELVTLARNRYWRAADGFMLDVGGFAAALEYASGREAILAGKPSLAFFRAALDALGVLPDEAAVVGDDLESDVGGGQRAGMRGVLVRTGKHRAEDAARSGVRPDAVLGSLAELGTLL